LAIEAALETEVLWKNSLLCPKPQMSWLNFLKKFDDYYPTLNAKASGVQLTHTID
jgi:hypothetical protein